MQRVHGTFSALHSAVGLRTRLLAAFMVVALVPLYALYVLQSRQLEREAVASAEAILERVANVQQRRVNLELERLIERHALVASRTQMRLSLAAHLREPDPAHVELIERILEDALGSMSGAVGARITDPDGQRVAGVDVAGASMALPVSEAPPLLALRWDEDGAPVFCLAMALHLDDERLGDLHIWLNLEDIGEVLDDFPDEEIGGQTVLALHGPDRQLRLFSGRSGPRHAAELVRALHAAGASEAMTAFDGHLYVTRPLAHDLGHVLAVISMAPADVLARQQMRGLLFNMLGVVLLSFLLSLVVARAIARPIRALSKAARELRDGAASARVASHSWGELAELTKTFNETAGALEQRAGALEAEVRNRRNAERELVTLANTDYLTGLVNRRHFLDLLRAHLSDAEAVARGGALLYADLDGFKPVNDALGHEAGDEALRIVAERLQRQVRSQDVVARLGGDEFAVLLTDAAGEAAPADVAARIESALSLPMTVSGQSVQVGCSVGVAPIEPGRDARSLVLAADASMYRVKQARRVRQRTGTSP